MPAPCRPRTLAQRYPCGTCSLSAQRPPASGGPRSALPERHTLGVRTPAAGRPRSGTRQVSAQRLPAPGRPRLALPVRHLLCVCTLILSFRRAARSTSRAALASRPSPNSARRHSAGRAQRSACGTYQVLAKPPPRSALCMRHTPGVRTAPADIRWAVLSALRAAHASFPHSARRHPAGHAQHTQGVRTPPAGILRAAFSAARAAHPRCVHTARRHSAGLAQRSPSGIRQVSAQRLLAPGRPRSALPGGTRKASAQRPPAPGGPRSLPPGRHTPGVRIQPAGTLLAALSATRAVLAGCPHSARRHPAGCAKRSACGTLAPVVRITPASTLRAAHTAHAGIRLAARGTVRAAQVSAHHPLASCGSCSALCVRHARGVRTTPASSGTTAAAVRHTPGVCTSTAGTLRAALSALRARYPHSDHRQPAGRAQRYLCGNRLVSAQRPRHFAGQDSATRAAHAL